MVFSAQQLRERQSLALINMKPLNVVLRRRPVTSDGAGGKIRGAAVNLLPQRMRLVPASSISNETGTRVTTAGRHVQPNWLLLCPEGTDIKAFDECDINGHNLEIVYVNDAPTERVVAECWEEK